MSVILVLGRGQLGRSLAEYDEPSRQRIVVTDRRACDIRIREQIEATLDRCRPDIVINAAGYTQVDQAETDSATAFAANAEAAGLVAEATSARGLPLVHVSTDYVFGGEKVGPYTETDPVNPLGVYARSKELGERLVRENAPRHIIVRTAWLYAPFGRNFLRSMLSLQDAGQTLRVVDDQFGSPTSTLFLADALIHLCRRLDGPADSGPWGTYHVAGAGVASWYQFAREIFRQREQRHGIPVPNVIPVSTREYPTPSPRPANTALDASKFARTFAYQVPLWQDALSVVMGRLPGAGHSGETGSSLVQRVGPE